MQQIVGSLYLTRCMRQIWESTSRKDLWFPILAQQGWETTTVGSGAGYFSSRFWVTHGPCA